MELSSIPVFAGITSTVIFVVSYLPMLAKAHRTRDLASYSLSNISLANLGNAVHSAYVFSLPPGPIWALHGFYLLSSALMLVWALRYGERWHRRAADSGRGATPLPLGEDTHAPAHRIGDLVRRGVAAPAPSVDGLSHNLRRSS